MPGIWQSHDEIMVALQPRLAIWRSLKSMLFRPVKAMPPNPDAGLRYSSECHYSRKNSMDKAVSAADANRRFSELLRTVKKGRSVIVTSHGKPVAKISPLAEDQRAAAGARSVLFARLRRERVVNAGRWTRGERYDAAA
jgi:prevent-host-death family protein